MSIERKELSIDSLHIFSLQHIEEHLPQLARLTSKYPEEIREVLNNPLLGDLLIIRDGWLVEVVREKIWTLLEAGELAKCVIEDKDKV